MARSDDVERRFHEEWIGMLQPNGLVVSIPVLLDAQCFARNPPSLQQQLAALVTDDGRMTDPMLLFTSILDFPPDRFDRGDGLPRDLAHYHEQSAVTPTAALKSVKPPRALDEADSVPDVATATTRAGSSYELLFLQVAPGQDFDRDDAANWSYPPALKLERLVRDTRVEIGILVGERAIRLIYAPHGQAAGSVEFPFAAMVEPGGRPILDALVMLLKRRRVDDTEWPLRRLLEESRERQANVTTALARQVFDALQILLDGFQSVDDRSALDAALARGEQHVYSGILTVLLRAVFVLYAEDRELLPMKEPLYGEHLSLMTLHAQLTEDRAQFPDTMGQRFGAWPRLLALFRTLYEGAHHGTLHIPARRGDLFDPDRYPFLEGRRSIEDVPAPPRISDDVVQRVLDSLLMLDRERLSYRSLDVEQIGSVYEKLMGYHVWSQPAEAVCLRGEGHWVTGEQLLATAPAQRESFLVDGCGLPKNDAKKVAAAVKEARKAEDTLRALDGVKRAGTERNPPRRLVLQPGQERRRTSSHYTPRSLSAPVVRRALEPLLAAMGGVPTEKQLLDLKICDPAMGSGAFLVEACRFLADQLVAAWARHSPDPDRKVPADPHERLMKARRLVAQRCLYGVDKNAMAVTLGRLSLWLVTMAADEPFTFVDHALKHGDSLVGLTDAQIATFHWKETSQQETFAHVIGDAVADALMQRQAILEKATCETEKCALEKESLHAHAEAALVRARLIGDVCVGAFFAADSDRAREVERKRRLDIIYQWTTAGGDPPEDLLAMQRTLRDGERGIPAFHWPIEFPEVFNARRADPLADGNTERAAWMDAFIGNPPFMAGSAISGALGEAYRDWLLAEHPGAHGNSDYVAHFFRRGDFLLGDHGTIGFVATKTIAQGDTRTTGLQALVASGVRIYDAIPIMKWPGERDAAVSIATVHFAKGRLATMPAVGCRFQGRDVEKINSRLRVGHERPDPMPLRANVDLSFKGSMPYGDFALTSADRDALIAKNRRNAERIVPYLGGDEINSSPTQDFERYIINFGELPLAEAEGWPDLLDIVRAKVKPERDKNNRETRRKYWWRYGETAPALYSAISNASRCLVTSRVSKHLLFAWQPTNRVFSDSMIVFAIEDDARFAVLQSRVHERWAKLLSSTMKADLRYAPSDCFENFPFPATNPALQDIGGRLYEARARIMSERNHGLTVLYNQLKDARVTDDGIVELRRLHEDMDRQVLDAYCWTDIAVPPFVEPTTADEKRAFAAFEDAVIDRLFAENARRAAAEAPAPKPTRKRK